MESQPQNTEFRINPETFTHVNSVSAISLENPILFLLL